MEWKYRYVWYSLTFAIVLSFVLTGLGVLIPFNLIGYVVHIFVIVYDWRIYKKSKLKLQTRYINEDRGTAEQN